MESGFDFSFDCQIIGNELLNDTNQTSRVIWLSKHVKNDDIYFMQDGELSKILFKEVLSTFVSGYFVATIVLGFSLIERTIAGRLSYQGVKSSVLRNKKSGELINLALQRKWICHQEFEHLNELRDLRNPIVHFRDLACSERPEARSALSGITTGQLFEADAENVIEVLINLLKKNSI